MVQLTPAHSRAAIKADKLVLLQEKFVFHAMHNSMDEKTRDQLVDELMKLTPDDLYSPCKYEKNNIENALGGRDYNRPFIKTPETSLLWAINLAHLAQKDPRHFYDSELYDDFAGPNGVAQAEKEHLAFHIASAGLNRQTTLTWERLGVTFYHSREEQRIGSDIILSLGMGFDVARPINFHEIGHSKNSVDYTPRMNEIRAEMEALITKGRQAELTLEEHNKTFELLSEWNLRHRIYDEAENNPTDRWVVNRGPRTNTDYALLRNKAEAIVADGMTGDNENTKTDNPSNRLFNLKRAIRYSFLRHNGYFEDTEVGWRSIGVNPDWISNADGKTGMEALDELKELCGGEKGVEFLQPHGEDLIQGEDWLKHKTYEYAHERGVRIDEIYERFAEHIIKSIAEEPQPQQQQGQEQGDNQLPGNSLPQKGDKPDESKAGQNTEGEKKNQQSSPQQSGGENKQQGNPEGQGQNAEGQNSPQQSQPSDDKNAQPSSGGIPSKGPEQDGKNAASGQSKPDSPQPEADKKAGGGEPKSEDEPKDQQPQNGAGERKVENKTDNLKAENTGGSKTQSPPDSKPAGDDADKGQPKQEGKPDDSGRKSGSGEPKSEDEPKDQKPQSGAGDGKPEKTGSEEKGKPEQEGKRYDSVGKPESGDPKSEGKPKDAEPQSGMGDKSKDPKQAVDDTGKGEPKQDGKPDDLDEKVEGKNDPKLPPPAEGKVRVQGKGEQDAPELPPENPLEAARKEIERMRKTQKTNDKPQTLEDLLQDREARKIADDEEKNRAANNDPGKNNNPQWRSAKGGVSNNDTVPQIGNWADYANAKIQFAADIARFEKIIDAFRERQRKETEAISHERETLPEDGDMSRFDTVSHVEMMQNYWREGYITEDRARRFQIDDVAPTLGEVRFVLLCDGSGSMFMNRADSGTKWPFTPIQTAQHAACLMNEACADKPGNERGVDLYEGIWGNSTAHMIIKPGDKPAEIGLRIAGLTKDSGWGTMLSPSIIDTSSILAKYKPRRHNESTGHTHFVIWSDGGLADENASFVTLDQLLSSVPNSTLDFMIIENGKTSLNTVAEKLQKKHGDARVGISHNESTDKIVGSFEQLVNMRLRLTRTIKANTIDESRRQFSHAHQAMTSSVTGVGYNGR